VAGKKERQRRLARERHERRVARESERRRRQRRTTQWASGVLVLLVVAAVVGFTFLHLNKGKAKPSALPTPSTSVSAPTPTPTPSVTEPATHCVYTPSGTAARNVGVPPATPDYKATYQATIKTNRGPIVIDLLDSKATCTVNSFVYLATKKYFDHTHCHRLTTMTGLYVLQCGDPTGTGTGGPGYAFADENLAGATYPAATVAMAHSSAPNSNGSQFFIVYKSSSLPPSYTPFGRIVSGLAIVQAVARAGVLGGGSDGHPKQPVVIESITIKKT